MLTDVTLSAAHAAQARTPGSPRRRTETSRHIRQGNKPIRSDWGMYRTSESGAAQLIWLRKSLLRNQAEVALALSRHAPVSVAQQAYGWLERRYAYVSREMAEALAALMTEQLAELAVRSPVPIGTKTYTWEMFVEQ